MKLVWKPRLKVADLSSPSRGTWIEIERESIANGWDHVVPLTGDVD